MGLAVSRREARQLVRHGHFTVNGKRVDIPSYLVKVGDVIAVKERARAHRRCKAIKNMRPEGQDRNGWSMTLKRCREGSCFTGKRGY